MGRHLGRVVALVLAGLLLGYAGLGAAAVFAVQRQPGWLTAAADHSGPVNLLLIGTDAGGAEPGRADALIIVHLPQDRSAVYLVSVPRLLQASLPEGEVQLRTAHEVGGVPLTVRAVEQVMGVRLQHAVRSDFAGFAGLADVVGGVTVHNPVASAGDRGAIPAGDLTLHGPDALAYVRDHSVTDDVRTSRQRAVLTAIAAKLPGALANPVALARLSTECLGHVQADDALVPSLPELLGRVAAGRNRIVGVAAPLLPRKNPWDPPVADPERMTALAAAMRQGTMAGYRAGEP